MKRTIYFGRTQPFEERRRGCDASPRASAEISRRGLSVRIGSALVGAFVASACGAVPPPVVAKPPPPPARVAFRVKFTTLSVVDDEEMGKGDWRVTLSVDGTALGKPILGEADSGEAVALERETRSEGLQANHKVIVTAKVEEYDGGLFSSGWNLIGEVTQVFGASEDWGVGAHRIPMETTQGKVEVLYQVIRVLPDGSPCDISRRGT